jgi:hypothetical protein
MVYVWSAISVDSLFGVEDDSIDTFDSDSGSITSNLILSIFYEVSSWGCIYIHLTKYKKSVCGDGDLFHKIELLFLQEMYDIASAKERY